jgi:cell wall assembly regulator SMI1
MINRSWETIKTWLKIQAPEILDTLQPGSTEEEIHDTETFLGVIFPDDMRVSYRICNGQKPDEMGYIFGLIDGWEFLSLNRIKEEWGIWKNLLDEGDYVTKEWWDPAWIPLTQSGSGDNHCIDLTYPSTNNKGNILIVWHDIPERPIVAPSFSAWLNAFKSDIENDMYIYSREYGGLVKKSEIK